MVSKEGSLIFAIDPGTLKSGYCTYKSGCVFEAGIVENNELLDLFPFISKSSTTLAVEMVASYGMTVGRETFETVLWTGRFVQRWLDSSSGRCIKVYRQDAKRCVCKTHKASDADIRAALISRLGEVGTKKSPGPLYGVKSHAWAALAVAVTAEDMIARPEFWKDMEIYG